MSIASYLNAIDSEVTNQADQLEIARTMLLTKGSGSGDDLIKQRMNNTMVSYSSGEITETCPYGFASQSNLEDVSLPNCTVIKNHTFLDCFNLSRLYVPVLQSIQQNSFRNCRSLLEFIAGPSFDSRLDTSTFEGCSNLVKADFYHINSIGINSYALSGTALVTVIIRNTDFVPPLNKNAFGAATTPMNTGDGRIYVPRTMVESYKSTTNWSTFADQILAIEDYPEVTQQYSL